MIGAYFITEFILAQFSVGAFTPLWIVIEGVVVCFAALIAAAVAPSVVQGFLWVVRDFSTRISNRSTKELISGFIGLIGGLVIAFLVTIPLNALPFGGFISVVLIIFFGYSGLSIGLMKKDDISDLVRNSRGQKKSSKQDKIHYLGILDTSAIIELKADYPDAYVMVDKDFEDVKEVDTKIIHLAVDMKTKIFTNDYNLNRMAQVQNVTVLNINDLAHALKSIVLPGEELTASIIKAGKEENQGVAYLDDGTMIVVENGKPYVGLTLQLEVTSALQTSNGKMIFAKPKQ